MPGWTKLLSRFGRQPARRGGLFIEALCYLISSRMLLVALPFRWLTRIFNRPPAKKPVISGAERRCLRDDVRWAVERAAEQLPGKTACFPRAIAAQAMCRRRGIAATLYYGAATRPVEGLSAHVWVLDDTEGVIGDQNASEFRVLARFPG